MRITKDRETRQAELVDTALALFLKNGYGATMVSDIVKYVGVAQGTFYYYFKTKEDMLDAVLEKVLGEAMARAERIATDQSQSALQRLEGLFRLLYSPRGSLEANTQYAPFLNDPAVHARLEEVRFRLLCPALKQLIEDGVEAGEIPEIRYPEELAEMALLGTSAFMHNRREYLTMSISADATMDALAEFMERLLGLPSGKLDFKDRIIRRHL